MLKKQFHLYRWFAVWTICAPEEAIEAFRTYLKHLPSLENKVSFVTKYLNFLLVLILKQTQKMKKLLTSPRFLCQLYLLMCEYIRPEDDIEHEGSYTPTARDDAQRSRNKLYTIITEIPGKETFLVLKELSLCHPDKSLRQWITKAAIARAEIDGDEKAWTPQQVQLFHDRHERPPKNHHELADLAELHLEKLRADLEKGDNSDASLLSLAESEQQVRIYIGSKISDKSNCRFTVTHEEELANRKKPDLRFQSPELKGPVPIELKLADNYTVSELFQGLEQQLCKNYLRNPYSFRGIYLLIYQGRKKSWQLSEDLKKGDFDALISALESHWRSISHLYPDIDDIKIIGINLTTRFN